jgi:isopentenyl-diphosphate delta-isomerase
MVVLLDDHGKPCGTAQKEGIHHQDTPLHLAFSCYVFDRVGRLLVTRRSLNKAAWPGVWTNSFCGHPLPDEDMTEAVRRRGQWELGIEIETLELRLPAFRYRAVDSNGVVENEVCPVFRATTSSAIALRASEACEYAWVSADNLKVAVSATPWAFSPWMVLQLAESALLD